MSPIIFDTTVLLDLLRFARHEEKIQRLNGIIRTSSVVLAELLRGSVKRSEREEILEFAKNHPIFTPTTSMWMQSGEILGRMQSDLGFTAQKLRDLHFDVLIALTACAHGARLITSNRADFEAIHRYQSFEFEVW